MVKRRLRRATRRGRRRRLMVGPAAAAAARAAMYYAGRGVASGAARRVFAGRVAKRAAVGLAGAAGVGAAANYAMYRSSKAAGVKRKYAGSSGAVKKTRTFGPPKRFGGEYVRNIVKRGRFVRSTVGSLAKLSMNSYIVRYQAVNALERYGSTVTGAYDCNWVNTGTSATPDWQLPLYLFCLNGATQQTSPVLFYRASLTGTAVALTAQNGVSSNGSTTTQTWTTEYARQPNTPSQQRYVQNKWYDIRLMLHNATSQPTTWRIDIVQFKDDYSDPIEVVAGVTATTQQLDDRRSLYQNLVKDMVTHPMLPQRTHNSRIRFIRSYKIVMNAEHNTEENASPNHREFRIFYNDGRINDYQPYKNVVTNTELGDTNTYTADGTQLGDYVPFPRPRARLYLMIRALDTGYSGPIVGNDYAPFKNGAFMADTLNEATPTSQNSPSFDLIVRKKEVRGAT